jgi:hypothetical protein
MWSIGEPVVGEVVPDSSPGDARLVGPLPARPVRDQTLRQEVVASSQTQLQGGKRSSCHTSRERKGVRARFALQRTLWPKQHLHNEAIWIDH